MTKLVWLVFLALCQQVYSIPVDSEDDIPPYLRGMGWRNVEKELQKDLRLDSSVRPMSYDINLNISVKGYGGASRSTFDGFVSIALNTSEPKNKIELHSVGLTIKKAEFVLASLIAEISKIEYNRERETVIFTLPQTLLPTDSATLKVYYNGTALMRGVGLFEYWTKPETKTESSLPTISLATSSEPTGARMWLPCFDEPDKKATFRLRLTHPSELGAYSNTAGETREMDNGLNETTFGTTVPLPTYAVAFAITAQPAAEIEHNGKMIRAIGRDRMQLVQELPSSMNLVMSQSVFENVTFFPEKTDWLVAEDYAGALENPGLIVSYTSGHSKSTQIHEMAHMYFGNLVTLRSWEQIWINEGFARFIQSGGNSTAQSSYILSKISAHEPAIHQRLTYTSSQFLAGQFFDNGHIHYSKAGQLISFIKKFIGEEKFDRALNRYLIDNSFGNGDSEMIINYFSSEAPEAREIMKDFVYQAGIPLLSVAEDNGKVIIKQRRFLRTYFVEELRDLRNRWTIPIYYKINGVEHMKIMQREVENIVLNIPANCSFSIDDSYPFLYAVHYINRKSNGGLSNIIAQMGISDERSAEMNNELSAPASRKRRESIDEQKTFCNENALNKTKDELMTAYLTEDNYKYLLCDNTLKNAQSSRRFLNNLLTKNELQIRNVHHPIIAMTLNEMHPGILIDFFTKGNENNELIDKYVIRGINEVAKQEEDSLEKIRQTVRKNPSFGANFYYTITKIFEEKFISNEKKKRMESADKP